MLVRHNAWDADAHPDGKRLQPPLASYCDPAGSTTCDGSGQAAASRDHPATAGRYDRPRNSPATRTCRPLRGTCISARQHDIRDLPSDPFATQPGGNGRSGFAPRSDAPSGSRARAHRRVRGRPPGLGVPHGHRCIARSVLPSNNRST
jgi:hypothetical protein